MQKQQGGILLATKKELKSNYMLYIMSLPALIFLLIFCYAPMGGLVMAFQKLDISKGIFKSPWVGFKNFEFLFTTSDAWVITRNTIAYNVVFIVLGLFLAILLAILLNELVSKGLTKVLQTVFIMPHFFSMAVVAIIVFAFLSVNEGYLNNIVKMLGYEPKNWYMVREPWPFILVTVNVWKTVGYSSVVYLAALSGISHEYYEAAMLDGATKLQQIRYITLPYLKPMVSILLIMSIGNIFRGDFGLFYTVPQNSGMLYPVTDVLDTYIYRGLTTLHKPGMATAAGLYQSVVCFISVLIANKIVAKIEPDNAMF
jgi:putative aldouronate transport system permease protein